MRRCSNCTSLTDDGPCSTCGHSPTVFGAVGEATPPSSLVPRRPVGAAEVALPTTVPAARGSYGLAGERPTGVKVLAILGMLYGSWVILEASIALARALGLVRQIAAIDAEAGEAALSLFTFVCILAIVIGVTIILVNFAFYRGAAWAWWVLLVVNLLGATDCFQTLVAVPFLPPLFQPFAGQLAWLAALGLVAYLGLAAYFLTPAVRRFVFGGPRRVAV